jgi:hypothetical protein
MTAGRATHLLLLGVFLISLLVATLSKLCITCVTARPGYLGR